MRSFGARLTKQAPRKPFRHQRHYGLTMEGRAACCNVGAAKGRLHRCRAGGPKVPFFNRRILRVQIGIQKNAITGGDDGFGGGFGAAPRRILPRQDFLIPFAARISGVR